MNDLSSVDIRQPPHVIGSNKIEFGTINNLFQQHRVESTMHAIPLPMPQRVLLSFSIWLSHGSAVYVRLPSPLLYCSLRTSLPFQKLVP
jgi:hypothetical protein